MTAAIRAPQPNRPSSGPPIPRPSAVRLVDPSWSPALPDPQPAGPPLVLIPGGREAVLRRRRTAAVYRRRRWAAAVLAVVVLFGVLGAARVVEGRVLPSTAVAAPGAGSSDPSVALAPATPATGGSLHVVRPGESVWSIARTLQPAGDIRPVVDRLVERSGGGALQVGQRLDLRGLTP